MKDLSFFCPQNKKPTPNVEVPGIDLFRYPEGHENAGQRIPWEMRIIENPQVEAIRERNVEVKTRKGQAEYKVDNRFQYELIVEVSVYPDMKSKELLDAYNTSDPVEVCKKILSLPGDFQYISEKVLELLRLNVTDEELQEEAGKQ